MSNPEIKKVIGVDGEGLTVGYEHLYCYMAACSTDRICGDVENMNGLSTEECFDFLLSLPKKYLLFGFSLGYDYTKIFEGMPDRKIWSLNHPEYRQGKKRQKSVFWKDYKLDLMSGRLKVSKIDRNRHGAYCKVNHRFECADGECEGCRIPCKGCKIAKTVTVWDIFKFFQASFINACKDWGVITDSEFNSLKEMKDKRGTFTVQEWPKIREYCHLECMKLATLGEKLLAAHSDAGLKLTQYHGAGSTGAAMLKSMGAQHFMMTKTIGDKGRNVFAPISYKQELREAIAGAFFGGRFEISRVGPVYDSVYSYDIASAYPYAFTFLPCLVHGTWKRVVNPEIKDIQNSSAALIRYELPYTKELGPRFLNTDKFWRSGIPWGPFPFRKKDGNIIYPITSGGGWLWKEEILAGVKHFPNVLLKEAWVYNTSCQCEVLRSSMPSKYVLRLEWGKEGKGIVVKLGCNSCYGKTAQSRGKNPPFQNFVWAGMTTSSCRAQLLDAICSTSDRSDVLMVATDGIVSRVKLNLPNPRITGTESAAKAKGKYPLGAWEEQKLKNGIMLIRPGVYFPLKNEDYKKVKARGVGKAILASRTEKVLRHWNKHGPKEIKIKRPMFFGMKSCVRRSADGEYSRDLDNEGSKQNYGTWTDQIVKISYDAQPKRPVCNPDYSLSTWSLPDDVTSCVYGPALGLKREISLEDQAMIDYDLIREDQPDK